MKSLIIRQNMTKQAAEGDGPSFEQQFGILTNGAIIEKLPQLDNMKLAFQIIEKTDDDSKACGVAIYLVGDTVIFVPSFFKQNKIQTGDMMFIAKTQQFLPLSDAWLAYIRDTELRPVGKQVPHEAITDGGSAKAVTIRDISDPITKTAANQMPIKSEKIPGMYFWIKSDGLTKSAARAEEVMGSSNSCMASVFLRGLLHLDPDMKKTASDVNIMDVALHMGADVTESLMDTMIKNADFMNATLSFYGTDAVNNFAKKAIALEEELNTPEVELILPLTKEAKTLKPHELQALHKDGFFIRKCAKKGKEEELGAPTPDVIRQKNVEGMFGILTQGGKAGLLTVDGNVTKKYVLPMVDKHDDRPSSWENDRANSYRKPSMMVVIEGDNYAMLPADAMHNRAEFEAWKPEMADKIGEKLTNEILGDKERPLDLWEDIFLVPESGVAYKVPPYWRDGRTSLSVAAENAGLKAPIITGDTILLPYGTRGIYREGHRDIRKDKDNPVTAEDTSNGSTKIPYVTMTTFDAFMQEYTRKHYYKTRIYNNGSDFVVSGEKSSGKNETLKEAALSLVKDYDIDPAVAKIMLKEAANGATFQRPKSSVWYIEKKAAFEGEYTNPEANISMDKITQVPPKMERMEMPDILENPENLQQAVTNAAQNGVKEVFDITALKILARQNHFFDEIHDDIPGFMKTLDSLCRKLFQFYWHTEAMEEKYGTVKLKSLEDSLKCTLDSLSDLTIFFKIRTVDGTNSTGDVTGNLVSGTML